MKQWNNKYGADLPSGQWNAEPDKAHWIDPATQLDCLIVRNQLGGLCGYVGVPPEHPWHGVQYDELEGYVSVHGGLTFSGGCGHGEDESTGICHVPEDGRPDNVWWQGFDCVHGGDLAPGMLKGSIRGLTRMEDWGVYRSFDYVKEQVAELAQQAADAAR